ncbi:MAG: hypothetical protein LBI05_06705 [Planctomycetaceae bacterium]|jgi:hypothetical protein|nr:hypothetical protein [Planctomycetaceae bacterium]
MKRFKIIAICTSFLAAVSLVGCVCPPTGYYSGMRSCYVPNRIYDNACGPVGCDSGCDPCGQVEACGAVEPCGPTIIAPQPYIPRPLDCRNTFSNLRNGMILTGRGILDVAAAPFVVVGNMLSSGCRYEVLTFCDNAPYCSPCYQTVEPCAPSCSSGCDSCSGGYNEGIQYNGNTSAHNLSTTILTPPLRMNNSAVIQASYLEPTAPVRFVQPK